MQEIDTIIRHSPVLALGSYYIFFASLPKMITIIIMVRSVGVRLLLLLLVPGDAVKCLARAEERESHLFDPCESIARSNAGTTLLSGIVCLSVHPPPSHWVKIELT